MKSGVHWLFFSFFQAGGQLMSLSSMSHTNMSSGCMTRGRGYDWSASDLGPKRAGPASAGPASAHLYSFFLNTWWRYVDVLPGQWEEEKVQDVNEMNEAASLWRKEWPVWGQVLRHYEARRAAVLQRTVSTVAVVVKLLRGVKYLFFIFLSSPAVMFLF